MAMAQTEFPLWKGDMPGEGAAQAEGLKPDKGDGVIRLTNVSEPTLAFYPATPAGAPAPMVIVCPGGGYNILSMDKEGTEVAEWLNSIGVSAAVLKYRCPSNREGALQDARRAVRMAREKSKEWNINPQRIGMLGFSAGGHLAAACSASVDRPDFTVLVYPAYLFQKGGVELVDEIRVDAETPPAFVVQAWDDRKHYRSSLAYSVALDAQGIPVELHLFAKGGHGYGLRPSAHPVSQWPTLCEAWMRESGFLK
ncbi:alpha/beta hydrolase [Pontiella sulfatireligans]|uniref:Acetylxylan esterase n=1 Tax=Pontiella sulfatireligans TaxID=2750658 RepID=A0A6C2UMU1_9BACT|nr:alpha/beta hydrolase [Pontiella sulfatireligans]VGO21329.1 Acetylxylan esterase [Pontiella sulfatireligans]